MPTWKYLRLEPADDPVARKSSEQLCRRSLLSVGIVLGLVALIGTIHPGTEMYTTPLPNSVPDGSTLRMVTSLWRHGDRTGIRKYRFEEFEWNIKLGKLTPEGMEQAFTYGQFLRTRYGPLVAEVVARAAAEGDFSNAVHINSTDVDRTVDTAHCVLLGLMSKGGTKTAITGAAGAACKTCRPNLGERASVECLASCLGLAKIPDMMPVVQVNSDEPDVVLKQAYICAGYLKWLAKFENSQEWLDGREEHMAAVDVLHRLTADAGDGKICTMDPFAPANSTAKVQCCEFNEYDELDLVERVWGDLECANAHHFRFNHKFTNNQLLETLTPAAEWVWHARWPESQGPNVAGIMLQDIMDGLRATALHIAGGTHHERKLLADTPVTGTEAPAPPAMRFYSAHDVTVFALLTVLGATDGAHLPGYVAHVMFELYQLPSMHAKEDPLDGFQVVMTYDGEPFPVSVDGEVVFPDGSCVLSDCIARLQPRMRSRDQCIEYDEPARSPKCHYSLDYVGGLQN